MDYSIVEPKIGSFYYMLPDVIDGTVDMSDEFLEAVYLNGGTVSGMSGEILNAARKGINKMNGVLWQFYSSASSSYDYTKSSCKYAGIYMCCGKIYDTVTDEMRNSPTANNINEYIWQNGDIKVSYIPGETEETAKIKIGELIDDEDEQKKRLVNTDYMPNTIQIYCPSSDITGKNTVIDKIVFYTAGTKKFESVLYVDAPAISIYKVGCIAKMVLKDGDGDDNEITPNVSKTSTDMEYLNGVISNASKAKTKLSPTEGAYIYTANGTVDSETEEFTPSEMMQVGDTVNLDNKKELIGAKYLVEACSKGDVFYISGRGYQYAALYALLNDTNTIISMYEGKDGSYTELESEFTLEIPEGVTKLLYNSTSEGSIYKNQTLADVAQQAVTRGTAAATVEEQLETLTNNFNKHIINELSDTAVHLTKEEKDSLLNPTTEGGSEEGGSTGGTGEGTTEG